MTWHAAAARSARNPRFQLVEIAGQKIGKQAQSRGRKLGSSFSILDTFNIYTEVWADYGHAGGALSTSLRRRRAELELKRLNDRAWAEGDYAA